jgi:protein TonB
VRVGGSVQGAKLIRQVRPRYPVLALQARIQGTVILEAIISKQGSVENLRVIQGHPLLIKRALEAVREWRYRPTVLNGVPVEMVTRITVRFNLA